MYIYIYKRNYFICLYIVELRWEELIHSLTHIRVLPVRLNSIIEVIEESRAHRFTMMGEVHN